MLEALLTELTRILTGLSVRVLDPAVLDTPSVYFANHGSHFDLLAVRAALPDSLRSHVRPVAAREYWQAGRVREFLSRRLFNAILIDRRFSRRLADDLRQAVQAIHDGDSLLVFPEGTRERGDRETVGRFGSGLFRLAQKRPGTPFVPIYLRNLNRLLPKGEIIPVPILCTVTIGNALRMEPDEPRADFLARLRDSLVTLTKEAP
jgi:1-acyl-sn-glycerol-3-phosphate acyltransferase